DTACSAGWRDAPPPLPFGAGRPPRDTPPLGDVIGMGWRDAARSADGGPAALLGAFDLYPGGPTIGAPSARGPLVDGDALLRAGSQFSGILVVRGVLTLESEVRVAGVVRAAQVALPATGTLAYDACAVDRALGAKAFRRVYRITRRWRLPAH